MLLKSLDGLLGQHLLAGEGQIATHNILHKEVEHLHQFIGNWTVQILQGAIPSSGNGVFDAKLYLLWEKRINGMEEQEIERTHITVPPVCAVVVEEIDHAP